MLSSHHYKSFKVSMIHRLRFTTDVQLGKCLSRVWTGPFCIDDQSKNGEAANNFCEKITQQQFLFFPESVLEHEIWSTSLFPPERVPLAIVFFMKQKIRNRTDLRLFSDWLASIKSHHSLHSITLLNVCFVMLPLAFSRYSVNSLLIHSCFYLRSF